VREVRKDFKKAMTALFCIGSNPPVKTPTCRVPDNLQDVFFYSLDLLTKLSLSVVKLPIAVA
jgi:hypothetical protein